jgi:hypothetical protein
VPSHQYLIRAVGAAIALGLSLACGSSSQTTVSPTSPGGTRCALQVQREPATFSPAGGAGQIRISVERECSWSARSEATWLSLSSPTSGQGAGIVPFTVLPNGDPSSRTGSIGVNDDRLQVSQAGSPCDLRVSSTHEAVEPAGGDRTVIVTASSDQCSWTASSSVSWIEIVSGHEGRGTGTVTFHVHGAGELPRSGVVMVGGHAVHVTVIAPSSACDVVVEPTTFAMPASGGPGILAVRAGEGCGWSAVSSAPWIAITAGHSGSGPGEVQFAVAPADAVSRTGAIRIGTAEVAIAQAAQAAPPAPPASCSLAASPTSVTLPAAGGSGSIQVTSGAECMWTALSNVPWIVLAGTTGGVGSGQTGYSVTANTGPARVGTMTVAGQTITVTQAGGCTYALSTPQELPAGGGTVVISVTTGAGCAWSAASAAGWLTVSPDSGAGPAQVQLAAAPNTGPARQATVTVGGQTTGVTQASGCTYALSTPPELPAGGGAGVIGVTTGAGCAWSAASAADWLTISSGSGSGPGEVRLAAAPNTGPARHTTVTAGGQTIGVRQASGCTYALSAPPELPAGGAPGVISLTTGAGCPWSASSAANWLTVSPGSGGGPAQVQLAAVPNTAPPRTTRVTIGGVTETIRQASACTWRFSPSSVDIDASGGLGAILVIVTGACTWTAVSQAPWVTVVLATGSGTGMVQVQIAPNPGPARTGVVMIADLPYTITQRGP